MSEFLQVCQVTCGRECTKEDVLTDMECNFCDVPYIILLEEKTMNEINNMEPAEIM